MSQNDGLNKFTFHSRENAESASVAADLARGGSPAAGFGAAEDSMAGLDPESAARAYLEGALESPDLPTFAAASVGGANPELKAIGHRTLKATRSQTVKFRQHYRKIPVYGSLVTVEMDAGNKLLSINSALGEPTGVNPVATLSPAEAVARVRQAAGYGDEPLDAMPRLYYYYDKKKGSWRLVYLCENVFRIEPEGDENQLPQLFDFVVDAHTGEIADELPRTQTIVSSPSPGPEPDETEEEPAPAPAGDPAAVAEPPLAADEDEANDILGHRRRFRFFADQEAGRQMLDRQLNVHTHDFAFQTLLVKNVWNPQLPGLYVLGAEPGTWDAAAVSAHANAAEVANFLTEVLGRRGLDDEGGRFISSINCVRSTGAREWRNAAWIGTQMVYGQRQVGGALRSYAVATDIVAHEIFHGVTEHTARLEYRGESGALNESYSDIFGIMISNRHQPDVERWSWQLGEELDQSGLPLRDLSDPTRHNQPAHMDDYRHMSLDAAGDNGGVHINSGIHNKAAFNLLTARGEQGELVLDPATVAQLFYLTLTEHLSRTSGFAESRRGVELVAQSLFRDDVAGDAKLAAVAAAFDAVGIKA